MKNQLYAVKANKFGCERLYWAWGYTPQQAMERCEQDYGCKVKAYRPATTEEEESYMSDAEEAARQVEREEAHGSTKTLPKDWTVNSDGWTLNQFGNPV